MTELPDDVQDAVLDVEPRAAGLPFGHVKICHLRAGGKRGGGANLLVNRAKNPIIDFQAEAIQAGLLFKQRGWR